MANPPAGFSKQPLNLPDHEAAWDDARTLITAPWHDKLTERAADTLIEALEDYQGSDPEMADLLLADLRGESDE